MSIDSTKSEPNDNCFEEVTPHYCSNLRDVVTVQSAIRRKLIHIHYQIIVMLNRKRTRVAKEIWNSETTYLEGLMTIVQLFQRPLEKLANTGSPILSLDEISNLFYGLDALIDASKKMNSALARVCTNFTPHSKIGEIFIDHANMLMDAFTPYADHYDDISKTLIQLKNTKPAFKDWLSTIEFKQCDLGLDSYLIMPIQRVTRYGLLLKELIHQTWQDHSDFDSLKNSLNTVEQVAQHVNEHKQVLINKDRIKTIQTQIIGLEEDLTNSDTRVHVTEGMVKELDSIVPLNHYIFLFNDIMIWTQMINKKKFKFRKLNWLKQTTAEPGQLNSLKVITDKWTTVVHTNNKEEQNKWLAYLENQDFCPPTQNQVTKRPNVVFLNKQTMLLNQLKFNLSSPGYGLKSMGSTESVKGSRNSIGIEKEKLPVKKKSSKKKKDETKVKRKTRVHAATIDPKMMEQHRKLAMLLKSSMDPKEKDKQKKRSSLTPEGSPRSRKEKSVSQVITKVKTSESKSKKRWSDAELATRSSSDGKLDEPKKEKKKQSKKGNLSTEQLSKTN